MVFQLAVVIVIPIILGMVVVPPFDLPEEPPESITIPDEPRSDIPDRGFVHVFVVPSHPLKRDSFFQVYFLGRKPPDSKMIREILCVPSENLILPD